MFKPTLKAPPVNGVAFGSTATLRLDAGPRYQGVRLIMTCAKTIATASIAALTLDKLAGLVNVKVNNVSKRQHTAVELNTIQTDWDGGLAAKLHSGISNDLLVTADTTGTVEGISTATKRLYTWVLDIWFADPSRSTTDAKQAFGWPTLWLDKSGKKVATADIQIEIAIPADASVAGTVVYNALAVRAEIISDSQLGQLDANGNPVMPVIHYYRQTENYSSTTPVIRNWPFSGLLQQISLFNQTANDSVGSFIVKKNNQDVFNTSKRSNNDNLRAWGWNINRLDVTTADSANNNQLAADVCHIAFDFDDDPYSALPFSKGEILELAPTLIANSGTSLVLINQVFADALAS
jgi:hypothetical protein